MFSYFKNRHNLIQQNQISWSVTFICICVITFFEFFVAPQKSFTSDEQTLFSSSHQIHSDTVAVPVAITEYDSFIYKSNFKLHQNHHFHPVNPYFRNGYRIIQDLRRLVQIFDRRAVHGYESMSDLVDICRKLPEGKQTEMIFTALAGGVVNFISEEASKQLKKRKINFLQWKLEKVILRNKFRYFYMNIHTGMNSRGIGLYIPALRIHYYRHSTPFYASERITFYPMRKFGFNCCRWNGSTIITPFFSSPNGTLALSYDNSRKIIRTRFELRKSSSIIIRIVYINFLERMNSDRLLSEVLICW